VNQLTRKTFAVRKKTAVGSGVKLGGNRGPLLWLGCPESKADRMAGGGEASREGYHPRAIRQRGSLHSKISSSDLSGVNVGARKRAGERGIAGEREGSIKSIFRVED